MLDAFSSYSPLRFSTIPTTDLYFLNACRHWIRTRPTSLAPLRQLGVNTFVSDAQIVVCRYDTPGLVRRALDDSRRRLIYVIDDDLWAAEDDATLPDRYRRRLIKLREGQHRALVDRADTIVVSSSRLAERYTAQKRVVALDPHWSDPFADASHFETLDARSVIRVGYLGTASHAADRAFAATVIENLLSTDDRVIGTMVGTANVSSTLLRHKRFQILQPSSWPRYRARIQRIRLHIALYPLMCTPFNRCRSRNKQIEHAVVGGVGIYSPQWDFAEQIKMDGAGLVVDICPNTWVETVQRAIASPKRLKQIQNTARTVAMRVNDPARQHQFWLSSLNV